MNEKEHFQKNFIIMYDNLKKSVSRYITEGYSSSNLSEIESYLDATIHAVVDYSERYLDYEDNTVKACNYVNNNIKHVLGYASPREVAGGLAFPFSFPTYFEAPKIVWQNKDSLKGHRGQKKAYIDSFVGKDILESLNPIAEKIINGVVERQHQKKFKE